jgi:tRNA(Ile)-lysidine synthase
VLEQFRLFIKNHQLQNAQIGVAISGGIDSVVLCELCQQAKLSFQLFHCNFGLRGTESDRDEAFVRALGVKYNVAVHVKHFETNSFAAQHKYSIQEAARALRYEWFKELHTKQNTTILLAHHANDNIETLLMNFFRGTGLEGMTGMPHIMPYAYCLRPLLSVTRKEIEAFAVAHQLKWMEDSSNASSKYTRNYFRNELIPAIGNVFPQVEENLLANIRRFTQINELYKMGVEELKKKVCETKGLEVHMPVLLVKKYLHTSLIYELIKEYGFGEKQVEEIIKLLEAESGKYIANESYQIIRHRNKLIISPVTIHTETIAVSADESLINLGDKKLELKTYPAAAWVLNPAKEIAQLNKDKIEFPLLLRKWKQGDYFYPLGMPKKKKLARFFIDQRIPIHEKEKIWVVESAGRIIWVMGMRIDDRFKVTPATRNVLELSVSNF